MSYIHLVILQVAPQHNSDIHVLERELIFCTPGLIYFISHLAKFDVLLHNLVYPYDHQALASTTFNSCNFVMLIIIALTALLLIGCFSWLACLLFRCWRWCTVRLQHQAITRARGRKSAGPSTRTSIATLRFLRRPSLRSSGGGLGRETRRMKSEPHGQSEWQKRKQKNLSTSFDHPVI
jgi:hypothetical protein